MINYGDGLTNAFCEPKKKIVIIIKGKQNLKKKTNKQIEN